MVASGLNSGVMTVMKNLLRVPTVLLLASMGLTGCIGLQPAPMYRLDSGTTEVPERTDGAAWLIATAPTRQEREAWLSALGPLARSIVLDTPAALCIERIRSAPDRAHAVGDMIANVERWFSSRS